jgi:hypothetical protein
VIWDYRTEGGMTNLFQKTSSYWAKYSAYELQKTKDGREFVTPAPKAKPTVYDPLKDADAMVLDALNVGMLQIRRAKANVIREAIIAFISKYGLLGFITALPTTPHFMDYDAAYLPKNRFIKEESMPVDEYAAWFFPFEKPDFSKAKGEAHWNVSGDREMLALAMTFGNDPLALNMSFQRDYAESYDWLAAQFKDWAFTFVSSYLYYEDYDKIDEATRDLYRKGMAAFGGIAPTYHIALLDKPTIVWDFYSLLLGTQMMFSFILTDDKKPLRCCRHCQKVFMAGHPNAVFCSHRCKNQYNVYKGRANKKDKA